MTEIDHLYTLLRPSLSRVTAKQFTAALDDLTDALQATPRPRCQLTLRRLRFSGEKRGDFRFFPGVNILRAGNDKGKSSVLKLIHFCLTGKNELKKDVDSWIDHVQLFFEFDGEPHAIEVEKKGRPNGRIVACRPDQPEDLDGATVLDEFRNGKQMQQKLESLFMQRLGLRPLMGTQKDSRKGSDRLLDAPTSYRAYVRGLYVTQDMGYTDLVTEGVPYGNLFMKVVGMLLGLEGLDGQFAVEARLAHVENLLAKEERYHRRLEASFGVRDLATLDAEIKKLETYIDELKLERTAILERATTDELDQRLNELTTKIVTLDQARQHTALALNRAENDVLITEQEMAELAEAAAGQKILGTIVPHAWPFGDIEMSPEQRRMFEERLGKRDATLRAVVDERLARAKSSVESQRQICERRRTENQELQFRSDQVAQQKRHLQAQLKNAHRATAELEGEIELETRYLGRLESERESASRMVSSEQGSNDLSRLMRNKRILQAVLRHVRTHNGAANERRKHQFARRVQEFCTTIGFPGLEDVSLDIHLKPRVSQHGKTYAFDELSPGEKVRFALAFHLGLALVTAEDLDDGAHPGLLLIDSPGKEEMVEGDFEAVVNLLSQIEGQHASSIQVIVATSIRAIRGATQVSKQYFIADDSEPVFG